MFEINSEIVRDALFQSGVGIRDFAKQTGLNELTLKKILAGGEKVSAKIVGKLAQALNVKGTEILIEKEKRLCQQT